MSKQMVLLVAIPHSHCLTLLHDALCGQSWCGVEDLQDSALSMADMFCSTSSLLQVTQSSHTGGD